MNVWTFTGYLGKDAELKYTSGGDPVCEFSVAVTSGYGDKKKTSWANCALFGKSASGGLPEYLKKGVQVAVSGEVTLDEWHGKDGAIQKAIKVRAVSVDLVGGGAQQSRPSPAPQQDYRGHAGSNQPNPTYAPPAPRPASAPTPQPQRQAYDYDLDIPF